MRNPLRHALLCGATSVALLACDQGNKAAPQAAPSETAAAEAKSPAAATAPADTSATDAPPAPASKPELNAPADVAGAPADAKKTASGLAYKTLTPGDGTTKPTLNDRVKVHYTGWTKAGQRFDSSVERNEPIAFAVTGVIPGWTEGLQLMSKGEKVRLWIPAKLAYGDKPQMMGAPAGDLVFDVELLEVLETPKPPETPADVKAPPKDAKKTSTGLAYKVLSAGTGDAHPGPTSRVTVHYSGWTTAGEMFDSSIVRGEPITFGLNQVIKGWTEGVQLMKKGEKTRFWIPGPLAYGDKPTRPGAPAGMLVFDIELLDF